MSDAVLRPRPATGPAIPWAFPETPRTVLPNGVRLVTCHLPGRAVAGVELFLDAPLADEPRDAEGVAGIAARALLEGAGGRDADAFAAALEGLGGEVHAESARLGARLSLSVPRSRLVPALELLHDAVASPSLPDEAVRRLVAERLDRITRELSSPGTVAAHRLSATLYDPADRASRPGGGLAESVGSVDRASVAAFLGAHAGPQTAVLVVAGDLAGLDVPALAATAFGGWSSAAAPTELRASALAPSAAGRVVVVNMPGKVQTELRWGRPGPCRGLADWPATLLATYVLGGGLTQRLSLRLREDLGYTYGIHATAGSAAPGGTLSISTSVETSVTAAAVHEVQQMLLAYTGSTPATAEEHEVAVDNLVGIAPLRLQSADAVAAHVVGAAIERLPEDYLQTAYARLRATTTEQVVEAGRRWWRPEDLTLVAAGDADAVVGPLEALGFARVEVVDP